jgi:O-antigen ligase
LGIVILVSMPFIVGDQPQGAESLNPVDMLNAVSTGGDASKQAILLGMYGMFCAHLLIRERPRRLLFLGMPLILLLCWTLASASWSVQPDVTLRRMVALTGSVGFGLYLGLRLDLRQMISVLSWAALAVLVASLLLSITRPSLGLDFEGHLRGVTAHKNALGSFAALAFLVALGGLEACGGRRTALLRHVALVLLALLCMDLARSTTVLPVLLATISALGLGTLFRRASNRELALLPLAACASLILAAIAVGHAGEIAELLGKDPDISGRTLVWDFVKRMILAQPLIGYGFGAFWVGGNSPGAVFWANAHLGVPHAHNGYLQLLLEAGFTALALILAAVALFALRAIVLMRTEASPLSAWPLGFLAFYLVANLSETWLWIGNELLPILFVFLVVRTNIAHLTRSQCWVDQSYAHFRAFLQTSG